jgi:hypothetical protein
MSSECLAPIACPECGSAEARRVCWTSWGGFLGPVLFGLVCCLDCGTRYGSRSGAAEKHAARSYLRVFGPLALLLTAAAFAGIALMQIWPT